jgi:hypothetical protein
MIVASQLENLLNLNGIITTGPPSLQAVDAFNTFHRNFRHYSSLLTRAVDLFRPTEGTRVTRQPPTDADPRRLKPRASTDHDQLSES